MTVDSKLVFETKEQNEELIHYFDIESIGVEAIQVFVITADGSRYPVPYAEVFDNV